MLSAAVRRPRLPGFRRPTDPHSLGFDFNAGLAAKVDDCLELALAISAGVDHLLEEFVALQETLVLLVPDSQFNNVFQGARLAALRVLLASVAGRIEVVTDSPGLQMGPQEALELRERIAAGDSPYRDESAISSGDDGVGSQSKIVALRQKLAEVRDSTQRGGGSIRDESSGEPGR